jgi:hypothetical protein
LTGRTENNHKNLRIVDVPAGHFANTNQRRCLEEDNIKMDLAEIACTGLNCPTADFCEKTMNFIVT